MINNILKALTEVDVKRILAGCVYGSMFLAVSMVAIMFR